MTNIANLNIDDNYVVCDAGGGTVDLITYRVADNSPLRLEESVRGTGDVCGSVLLNQGFAEYLAGKLGHFYQTTNPMRMERLERAKRFVGVPPSSLTSNELGTEDSFVDVQGF